MNVKMKRMRADAHIPGRATEGSAGFDLRACCDTEGVLLEPMERALVPTGVAIELPDVAYVALLFARSGLSIKQGLTLVNGVGVIDSDYRGEISVPLINLGNTPVHITNGDRIAQLVIMPVAIPEMVEFGNLSDTERGGGGFGSTGV